MLRNPKDDPKFRRPKPAPEDDPGVEVPEAGTYPSAQLYSQARTTRARPAAGSTRGRRSADARTLKRYGRTRCEVDAFIAEHYATKGPKWVGGQLGVKVTTVIMRARALGLPPLR
jgi:hypothetical protein